MLHILIVHISIAILINMYIAHTIPLLLAAMATAAPAAEPEAQAGYGQATTYGATTTWSFSKATSLPEGLSASSYTVGAGSPKLLAHKFEPKNVYIEDGYLNLLVPGGQQGQKVISSAEVASTFETLYGSVSIWAILTEESGVCNGLFFYKTDSQEVDIEFISDPASKSNLDSPTGKRMMQYTNQALDGNPADATMEYGPLPDMATSTVHEYRVDWSPNATTFYIDGKYQRTLHHNVPNEAASWVSVTQKIFISFSC